MYLFQNPRQKDSYKSFHFRSRQPSNSLDLFKSEYMNYIPAKKEVTLNDNDNFDIQLLRIKEALKKKINL